MRIESTQVISFIPELPETRDIKTRRFQQICKFRGGIIEDGFQEQIRD